MTDSAMRQVRDIIAWVGVSLGVIAIALTLYFNNQQSDKTAAALDTFARSSCVRQHASADQWNSVIAVIRELNEKAAPGSSSTPAFEEFVTKTRAIYESFPACVGLRYDPASKTAS